MASTQLPLNQQPGLLLHAELIPGRHGFVAAVELLHRQNIVSALTLKIKGIDVCDQRWEELEPGSVGGRGVELESAGKHCRLIKALKAFCQAFSGRSGSDSFSICLVSLAIRSLSLLTRKISLASCYGFAGPQLHSQLELHHALLVAGSASPDERRAYGARRIAATHQNLSPRRQ